MRIISGEMKGRKLVEIPRKKDIRPTADKVREAIFDSIQFKVNGSKFLDIFAGSGAVGLEAMSRGAEEVVFIDNSHSAVNTIKENLSILNKKAKIICSNFKTAFTKLKGSKFDIIFADPPYLAGVNSEILQHIFDLELLADDGIIILEHKKDVPAKNISDCFKFEKERKYGNIHIAYFTHKKE